MYICRGKAWSYLWSMPSVFKVEGRSFMSDAKYYFPVKFSLNAGQT
jgi:hypothetical protein